MLDAPAAYTALWQITADTGIKPEWLLPVLWLESQFNPAVPNSAGQPFYGINQASTALIQQYADTDPQTYLTWPASQQLSTVVDGYLKSLVHSYGPLRSATRVYQSNFLPATLATAKNLTDVIASAANDPYNFYKYNSGLDVNHDGQITVADIAAKMKQAASTPQVQQAIVAAYAAKDSSTGVGLPFSTAPTDINHIVYGDDYSTLQQYPVATAIAVGAIVVAAGVGVGYGIESGAFRRAYRRLVR